MCISNEKISKINTLSFYYNKLEKDQNKPKARRKEIMKNVYNWNLK